MKLAVMTRLIVTVALTASPIVLGGQAPQTAAPAAPAPPAPLGPDAPFTVAVATAVV
jgi:hypothetical protein